MNYKPLVKVKNLEFSYDPFKMPPSLCQIDCIIDPGSRVLLVGSNGVGKSTLLRDLSGSHLFSGMSYDEFLVLNNEKPMDQYNGIAYLGEEWLWKRSGFKGMEPFSMDIAARDMMKQWQQEHIERRDELVKILGINLDWRMHRVSDGLRKKVRIMLKLLRPFRLCFIDEFASELDIYSRKRLMEYLTCECLKRKASICLL